MIMPISAQQFLNDCTWHYFNLKHWNYDFKSLVGFDWVCTAGSRLGVDHGVDLVVGVVEAAGQLGGAPELLQEVEPEGAVLASLVDVGDSAEKRTKDDLGVILEEVYLDRSVGEMHHNGAGSSEPRL